MSALGQLSPVPATGGSGRPSPNQPFARSLRSGGPSPNRAMEISSLSIDQRRFCAVKRMGTVAGRDEPDGFDPALTEARVLAG
jgi:hypothetical protein